MSKNISPGFYRICRFASFINGALNGAQIQQNPPTLNFSAGAFIVQKAFGDDTTSEVNHLLHTTPHHYNGTEPGWVSGNQL